MSRTSNLDSIFEGDGNGEGSDSEGSNGGNNRQMMEGGSKSTMSTDANSTSNLGESNNPGSNPSLRSNFESNNQDDDPYKRGTPSGPPVTGSTISPRYPLSTLPA